MSAPEVIAWTNCFLNARKRRITGAGEITAPAITGPSLCEPISRMLINKLVQTPLDVILLDIQEESDEVDALLDELLDYTELPIIFNDVSGLTINEPLVLDKWFGKLLQKIVVLTRPVIDGESTLDRNYESLIAELPPVYVDKKAEIARNELDKIHALEAEAMKDEDLVKKKNELQDAQKRVDKMETAVETDENQLESLLQLRSDFSNSRDEHSLQALQLQVSELRNDSLADLYAMAQKTARPDDDVSVSRIRDLQRENKQLSDEIKQLRAEEAKRQQSLREIDELRRRFRRRNYDSRHSHFPGGFELAILLGRLLAGRMSGGGVWDQIRRNQRFRRPRAPKDFGGGIFPGGFGGRGRGGGFGGGFGGGGGFKTGGSF